MTSSSNTFSLTALGTSINYRIFGSSTIAGSFFCVVEQISVVFFALTFSVRCCERRSLTESDVYKLQQKVRAVFIGSLHFKLVKFKLTAVKVQRNVAIDRRSAGELLDVNETNKTIWDSVGD